MYVNPEAIVVCNPFRGPGLHYLQISGRLDHGLLQQVSFFGRSHAQYAVVSAIGFGPFVVPDGTPAAGLLSRGTAWRGLLGV